MNVASLVPSGGGAFVLDLEGLLFKNGLQDAMLAGDYSTLVALYVLKMKPRTDVDTCKMILTLWFSHLLFLTPEIWKHKVREYAADWSKHIDQQVTIHSLGSIDPKPRQRSSQNAI